MKDTSTTSTSQSRGLELLIFALAASLAATACVAGDPIEEGDVDREDIVDGVIHFGEPAIAFLLLGRDGQLDSSCTGTLIAPQTILTAAHCMYKPNGVRQNTAVVYFGADPAKGLSGGNDFTKRDVVTSSDLRPHPGYTAGVVTSPNDIAVVILDRAAKVAPHRAPLASSLGNLGNRGGRMVGYGHNKVTTNPDGTFSTSGDSKKRVGVGLIPATGFADESHIFVDGRSVFGNQCRGDSGGPLFVNVGGRETLVGVSSFGDGPCQVFSANQRVDTALGFISANAR